MKVLAEETADAEPDLVALPEATLWRAQGEGATTPTDRYDFVSARAEAPGRGVRVFRPWTAPPRSSNLAAGGPMTHTPTEMTTAGHHRRRAIRLSGYLEMRMEDVIDACAPGAGIEDQLQRAFGLALPLDGPVVTVEVLRPTWVSGDNASIPLSWRVHRGGELVAVGTAALSVLRVQSGHDPLTELLLSVDISEPAVVEVAPVLRQVLDEVSSVLEQRRPR